MTTVLIYILGFHNMYLLQILALKHISELYCFGIKCPYTCVSI